MNKTEYMNKLIDDNNGYLITSEATNYGISKTYISYFIKQHQMEKVAQGIYILDDVWPDELFILQQRNKMIIYSGETALYLHGLIDREYSKVCFSVPIGYNASHIKLPSKDIRYIKKDIFDLGVCETPSISGNNVRLYNKERCICDLIKNRKKYEIQLFQTALKEYMSSKDRHLTNLIEIAQTLGIRDKVMKYVEVML